MKGVLIRKLNIFSNDDGKVMHMMSSDDELFKKFGEIYFSVIYPGKVKGWHKSNNSAKNYAVIKGNVLLVLYDGKDIQEIEIGEDNYCLVQIPSGVWSSFKALGDVPAIIADLTELPYHSINYEKANLLSLTDYWNRKAC